MLREQTCSLGSWIEADNLNKILKINKKFSSSSIEGF